MENKQNKIISPKEKIVLTIGMLGLILVAAVLLVFYSYNFYSTTVLTQESTGQFGDFFGGVLNPILSFATVALLVWSIQIQLRELKLSRDELKANTKANNEQAKELRIQNDFARSKENSNTQLMEFDNFQKLFIEQQSVLNTLLGKPIGLFVSDRYITFNDLIYINNNMFQKHFEEYIETQPNNFTLAQYQVAHTLNQCIWILVQTFNRCKFPGFVGTLKSNIDWLFPFISVCYERNVISQEKAKILYKNVRDAIDTSDFEGHAKHMLFEQLDLHSHNKIKS